MQRKFSVHNQIEFAEFSGDFNPIHVDPIFARRTIAGECIVHGVHGVMWAIESIIKTHNLVLIEIDAEFLKPITLDQSVTCTLDQNANLLLLHENEKIFTRIQFKLSKKKIPKLSTFSLLPKLPQASDRKFMDCSARATQDFGFSGNSDSAKILFPSLVATYGLAFVCELAATSEIVGMRLPGLHSLFSSLNVKLRNNNHQPVFKVLHAEERFGLLTLSVEAYTFQAEIKAFFRTPSPKAPTIKEISTKVSSHEFDGVRALVIGGSRGLGEITAKLIAAGGGEVVITYHAGKSDAMAVAQEIIEYGGSCEVAQLSAEKQSTLPSNNFNQLYFFATPKISAEDSTTDGTTLYENYKKMYINAFADLFEQFRKYPSKKAVFCPSTTFLDNSQSNFKSYVKAKLEGEKLCDELSAKSDIPILMPRLPRLETDQTISIYKSKFPDSVEILLPHIQAMASITSEPSNN